MRSKRSIISIVGGSALLAVALTACADTSVVAPGPMSSDTSSANEVSAAGAGSASATASEGAPTDGSSTPGTTGGATGGTTESPANGEGANATPTPSTNANGGAGTTNNGQGAGQTETNPIPLDQAGEVTAFKSADKSAKRVTVKAKAGQGIALHYDVFDLGGNTEVLNLGEAPINHTGPFTQAQRDDFWAARKDLDPKSFYKGIDFVVEKPGKYDIEIVVAKMTDNGGYTPVINLPYTLVIS